MKGIISHVESLRAIAVLAVIVNHINSNWLPGGYLGVDVFFVISGFVITRSLLSMDDGSVWGKPVVFYSKRVKRIVPALVVVVMVSIALLRLVNPDTKVLHMTGVTAMLGASNIFLYLIAVDYFGTDNKLNPLMHTWSLGVEEQFYFFYPFVLFWVLTLFREISNAFLLAITLISTISFLAFSSFIESHQSLVYYLMPFRIWELGLGCLLGKRQRIRVYPSDSRSVSLTPV